MLIPFLRNYIYWDYSIFVDLFIGNRPLSTFFLLLELFWTFFEHINTPLLDLSWRFKDFSPQGLAGGCFSIHLNWIVFLLTLQFNNPIIDPVINQELLNDKLATSHLGELTLTQVQINILTLTPFSLFIWEQDWFKDNSRSYYWTLSNTYKWRTD